MLEASARLVVDPLKDACANAIGARLAPSNALNVWRLADTFTLPTLEKAAVEAALRGFEELPSQLARGAEVLVLVQEDRLVAKSGEAVFEWVVRWWEAAERPEAELLAVIKHVRFGAGDRVHPAWDGGCVARAVLCGSEAYALQRSAARSWVLAARSRCCAWASGPAPDLRGGRQSHWWRRQQGGAV